ncbi:thiol:disulfide interchange protein tlpA [Ketogulonicigenium robustum]|uniref:Thiol:disulfide interchange protein tlpA n=1 Tax=Ketogulonicigenium robustum TaxID=92947 RepID=A0A1W6NX80_9RHOB|nr:TlpA disulfide reductase family protein [Ketogulonicigenium robustum]ARO13763.1 thiol:disulfide interchange protein tlpA [Ketogulonicigenium robustum]
MQKLVWASVYTALALMANTAMAAGIADLREGDMRKLAVHDAPVTASSVTFTSEDGDTMSLADLQGKVTVLNFWATWCAPCRVEMPTLSALQTQLGGDDFQVVTIATGRNDRDGMERFFDEIGVDNLDLHTDPRQALARDMGVMGLPVTVILDREGREVARLMGDADWSSDSAKSIIGALIAQN